MNVIPRMNDRSAGPGPRAAGGDSIDAGFLPSVRTWLDARRLKFCGDSRLAGFVFHGLLL